MRPAILIHGPTASGKTEAAIQLAKRVDGEILNADAMQVYRDLDVLTARPRGDDLARAPHHLFGHVDAAERHSVGRWQKEAAARIAEVRAAGKAPIVVGGTGLYLQALVEGLSDIPEIPEGPRTEARRCVAKDAPAAFAKLREIDPEAAARIDPGDRQRISRALEVFMATGKAISDYRGAAAPVLAKGEWIGVALTPPRDALYDRINSRVDMMMKAGALEEARALWSRQLDRELPAMRAHGVPGFCEFFEARIPLAEAIERAKRDTRRYAKRQLTWIAHQFTLWPRIPAEAPELRVKVIGALSREAEALAAAAAG
jgi:tRNA dimethylallyltransferase